jgi:hypothetical protein
LFYQGVRPVESPLGNTERNKKKRWKKQTECLHNHPGSAKVQTKETKGKTNMKKERFVAEKLAEHMKKDDDKLIMNIV